MTIVIEDLTTGTPGNSCGRSACSPKNATAATSALSSPATDNVASEPIYVLSVLSPGEVFKNNLKNPNTRDYKDLEKRVLKNASYHIQLLHKIYLFEYRLHICFFNCITLLTFCFAVTVWWDIWRKVSSGCPMFCERIQVLIFYFLQHVWYIPVLAVCHVGTELLQHFKWILHLFIFDLQQPCWRRQRNSSCFWCCVQ